VNQQSLFRTTDAVTVIDRDGEATLWEHFLEPADAGALLAQLLAELPWKSETLHIHGRDIIVPRRVCWFGDPGAVYTYSGLTHEPLPWPRALSELKNKLEAFTGALFNSVLANLYRDGNDAMGWHADKEKELGQNPVIASISLGAARRFKLQHTRDKTVVEIVLEPGSLLLMAGRLQYCWRHSLPRTREVIGPRINLTFRLIK
jgi:alkylated DNA repair dioxygenase AlkB